MATAKISLYEQLGGAGKADAAVEAVVDKFYGRLLAIEAMKPFFDGVDMTKQKRHQSRFVTLAFGGPVGAYLGRAMGPAHARVRGMGMTDEHFDIVKNTLAFTIKEDFGFTDEQVAQAAEVVESTREQIMGRAP